MTRPAVMIPRRRYDAARAPLMSAGSSAPMAAPTGGPARGDDPMTSGDTTRACAADERVSLAPAWRATGGPGAGDDPMTSGDTTARAPLMSASARALRGVRRRADQARGDDPMTSGDTTCACAADERVSSAPAWRAPTADQPAGDDPHDVRAIRCARASLMSAPARARAWRRAPLDQRGGDDLNGSDTECDWVGITNYQEFRGDVTRSPLPHPDLGTRRGTQRFFCDAARGSP